LRLCIKNQTPAVRIRFNTDQGVQFTAAAFTNVLAAQGVQISMDGKGRFLDNIFIERLWRSLKYEEVFIKAYDSVGEARQSIGAWLLFYNEQRKHQALGYKTPREIFADNTPAADEPHTKRFTSCHKHDTLRPEAAALVLSNF
jgi:transposase InsO family protein